MFHSRKRSNGLSQGQDNSRKQRKEDANDFGLLTSVVPRPASIRLRGVRRDVNMRSSARLFYFRYQKIGRGLFGVSLVLLILLYILLKQDEYLKGIFSRPKRFDLDILFPQSQPQSSSQLSRGTNDLALSEVTVAYAREDRSLLHPIKNGLLTTNFSIATHPIDQLVVQARAAWDLKLRRQSRTLRQAVAEYIRRNGRDPPLGFDQWWAFVCDNNIQLPDEYDYIAEDLAPYYGLSTSRINVILQEAIQTRDTFTVGISDGRVTTSMNYDEKTFPGTTLRVMEQASIMESVAKYVPDMISVFTIHDNAGTFITRQYKEALTRAGKEGRVITELHQPAPEMGLSVVCSQNNETELDQYSSHHKRFIADHTKLVDQCLHPNLELLHGATLNKPPHGKNLGAIFCYSKTSSHAEPLTASLSQWVDPKVAAWTPWSRKRKMRLLWRGSTTGYNNDKQWPWRKTHRFRLVEMMRNAENRPGEAVQILPPTIQKSSAAEDLVAMNVSHAVNHTVDFAFVGQPIQCTQEDGTCDAIVREYKPTKDHLTWEQAADYRFVIDVDGNGWSGRFQHTLLSGSLVFKSTLIREWWHYHFQPWVHYIPIQLDYSDIFDTVAYFQRHDALAKGIADAGRDWTMKSWRKADVTAYNFRFSLEWARLVSGAGSFVYDPGMERVRLG